MSRAEAVTVELLCEDARWDAADLRGIAERAVLAALAEAGVIAGGAGASGNASGWEVSLLAADDARIAALNGAFRGKASATNVLSWPAFAPGVPGCVPRPGPADEGEPVFLGDIALGYETCLREAEAAGVSLAAHAAHLVVHGVMHLVGFDHQAAAEAERMGALETKILARMGVAHPYRP
ncbi:rRNA maturation RNase YbeY [soil metagenome]